MKPKSLSSFVSGFKSAVTSSIRKLKNKSKRELCSNNSGEGPSPLQKQHKQPEFNVCQRNYYEHIIRDEKDYIHCVNYIRNNPKNWKDDEYNIEE